MNYVIVLEDDSDIRQVIELLLVSNGFNVRSFKNSAVFHQYLQSNAYPDLFILDIRLPDGNGVEICNELKSDSRTSHIPVILMSANADPEVIDQSKAEAFIAKPFDIELFLNKVATQIRA